MADAQDIKIAVLEREIAGLREQHKEHKQEIKTALDKVAGVFFDNLKEMRNDIVSKCRYVIHMKNRYGFVIDFDIRSDRNNRWIAWCER